MAYLLLNVQRLFERTKQKALKQLLEQNVPIIFIRMIY